jgi:hypothetical protein
MLPKRSARDSRLCAQRFPGNETFGVFYVFNNPYLIPALLSLSLSARNRTRALRAPRISAFRFFSPCAIKRAGFCRIGFFLSGISVHSGLDYGGETPFSLRPYRAARLDFPEEIALLTYSAAYSASSIYP